MKTRFLDLDGEHGDAKFSAFDEYYMIMYNHIRRYQFYDRAKNYPMMYESLCQLFDFVAIKFSDDVEKQIVIRCNYMIIKILIPYFVLIII